MFSVMDTDNNGYITFPEFYEGFTLFALARDDQGMRNEFFFRSIDTNNDGSISFDELVVFIGRLQQVGTISERDALTINGWGKTVPKPPEQIAQTWMKRYEINENSSISKRDFLRL